MSSPQSSRSSSPIITPAESSAATVPIDSSLKRDILKSMVQVAVRQTRSYAGSFAGTYRASAFLVNQALGLFFTAGHAVQGPCEGYIISHNDERCDFTVKYKDPEHDYAILQCPVDELQALDLVCLTLSPEKALVGSHVYLIGNDSGEKVNILRGTISRLDTASPIHFDSNVELIQASAAGKGGCSGGPLLSLDGEAIGICVSGHNKSHLDWFFPLDCPVRVLDDMVHNRPVSRGTLHTVWKRLPFYECRQLGLTSDDRAGIKTDRNGLLVTSVIIPDTETYKSLRVNDILLSINGKFVGDFSTLEEIFNGNVGKKVQVCVIRFGAKLSFDLNVHDLSAITPIRILADSGASFHNVPYRTAVTWKIPLTGMCVADSNMNFSLGGDSFGYIISSINNCPTPNVTEGEKVLLQIQDRERVAVRYKHASRNTRLQTAQVTIDRHWQQMALTQFNPKTEEWEYSAVNTGQFETHGAKESPKVAKKIESGPSNSHWIAPFKKRFVQVSWIAPYVCLDEVSESRLEGFGFIICKGLLLVTRAICPHDLCDIHIEIDGREVLGEVLHMDHRQNWVLIRYDPSDTSTESLDTVEIATEDPGELDTVTFIGMDGSDTFQSTKATVSGAFVADFTSPTQHAEAIDVLQIDSDIAHMCLSGIILNESHQLAGFWLAMKNDTRYVLPTTGIASVLHAILAGGVPKTRRTFNFRVETIPPKDARVMGVGDEYINHGISAKGAQHRFFSVKRVTRELSEYIQHGDIFLSINGKTVDKFVDFDALDNPDNETAQLLMMRDGNQVVVDLPLKIATDTTTDRVTFLFGLIFQRPYTYLKYTTQDFPSNLIFTSSVSGSPGHQSSMPYDNFIIGVNGTRVYDRESFLEAVKKTPDEKDFTIQSEDWNGKEYNDIVRKTSRAFEPFEFVKEDKKWKKISLGADSWKAKLPVL